MFPNVAWCTIIVLYCWSILLNWQVSLLPLQELNSSTRLLTHLSLECRSPSAVSSSHQYMYCSTAMGWSLMIVQQQLWWTMISTARPRTMLVSQMVIVEWRGSNSLSKQQLMAAFNHTLLPQFPIPGHQLLQVTCSTQLTHCSQAVHQWIAAAQFIHCSRATIQ